MEEYSCLVGGQTADKCADSSVKTKDSRMEKYGCLIVSQAVWLEVELQRSVGRQQGADFKQQVGGQAV